MNPAVGDSYGLVLPCKVATLTESKDYKLSQSQFALDPSSLEYLNNSKLVASTEQSYPKRGTSTVCLVLSLISLSTISPIEEANPSHL